MTHTATFITRIEKATVSIGRSIEKQIFEKRNFVGIDNKGSIPAMDFINKLVNAGRLPWEMKKATGNTFTDAYLTQLLNENIDVFQSTLEYL